MARRKKQQDLPDNIAGLVRALQFVSLAQEEEGSLAQTHCTIGGRSIIANNGLFSLGCPIDDDFSGCPHTKRFLSALLKCDGSVSITQLPTSALSVKAGKFKATIQTVAVADLPQMQPDANVYPIDDGVRAALAKVAPIAKENAPRVVLSSVLLRENTAIATTGTILIEAWHGFALPTMALPKAAVDALLKIDKPLAGFGFGGSCATFYFDDGSYLRTQLYVEQWPAVDGLLNVQTRPVPMPPELWPAVEGIRDFAKRNDGYVVFGENQLQSHRDAAAGACYELPSFGIVGKALALDLLDVMRPHAETCDFITYPDKAYFFSAAERTRGVIMYAIAR